MSLNGTFERKTITVPYAPDSLKVGRQTNQRTVPTPTNGYFDSKVLSRQHAEIHAERNGKIFIRDVKSSNGTFVNGSRLSQENRESDPHELQTADHLELGIDIVSEDQKTVVHHKVAARVEHAGFPSATSNVLDMTFGDLDPASGTMMMPNGPLQMRGRPSANVAMGNNGGRFMGGNGPLNGQVNVLPPQRSFLLAPIATDIILKRLTMEMRNARLQAQDLGRTNHFVHTLLSKADVKDVEKLEMPEPGRSKPQRQPSINGRLPFRSDAAKARFSEPPAPPPQQPLPEKPDVLSLRRGSTDRLKSGLTNAGPTRHESLTQIVQLTEALKKSKRDMDSQTARMRELEDMLKREREAREIAEDLAKRLEATAQVQTNGSVAPMGYDSSIAVHYESEKDAGVEDMELEELVPDPQVGRVETSTNDVEASLQARIDNLDEQMRTMRDQLQHLKDRCESAELERDESQKSLAEMVVQLRAEEAKRIAAEKVQQSELQSRSILSSPSQSQDQAQSLSHRRDETNRTDKVGDTAAPASAEPCMRPSKDLDQSILAKGDADDIPTLSRANTITPLSSRKGLSLHQESLEASLPYASMIGVVLIGMGLMAYINGWQSPSPSRIEP
ncbi:hypothetical protein E4U40_007435 [Claviceps sp. LM458 group G5]|nr:hypothetical protein E4U40_007435 [Claviceps sp. LM458 group G5]